MNFNQFFKELKRRSIYKVAVTYTIVAWFLLQLVSVISPMIDAPQWMSKAILVFLIVGFPIALVLAWAFEMSPEGMIRTTSSAAGENPLAGHKKKPLTSNLLIGFLLLLIAGQFIYSKYWGKGFDANNIGKSIVILPFDDISQNKDQEYFSDGMMEEILNHIVKIKELKVISRTTSMRYKNTDKSLVEVAEELGVATVLQGSVRKADDQIRITVQLIDGYTDANLWSKTYDFKLNDVFEVQSKVAYNVAAILQAEINAEKKAQISAIPTSNVEAYNLYLLARHGNNTLDQRVKLYEQAIILDSKFIEPYCYLAMIKGWGWSSKIKDSEEAFRIAESYIRKAIDINPKHAFAHWISAYNHLYYRWDFKTATEEIQIAQSIDFTLSGAYILLAIGEFEDAQIEAKLRTQVNPFSADAWGEKIITQYFNDPNEALNDIESAINLGVYSRQTARESIRVYLYMGMYDKVIETITAFWNMNEAPPYILSAISIAYFHLGHLDNAARVLETLKEQSLGSPAGSPYFSLATIYAQNGDIDIAFDWLDKALQKREVEIYWLKVEPHFEPLRDDSRWSVLLDKVGFPD